MKRRIIVIDDDTRILQLLDRILAKQGFEITTCPDGQVARASLEKEKYDLIICDLALNNIEGTEILMHSRQLSPDVPFIIITGYNSVSKAVECMQKGAFEYIVKPFENATILEVIQRAFKDQVFKIPKKNESANFENIVGQSEKMREVFRLIGQIADTTATVMIQGESGTGKELIAKAVHSLSSRKKAAFIPVNCGTLSENLLENELFGHVQGAFTGAIRYKKGLLAEADKGTVFLDEICETPLSVQSKLLRVLQEKEFKPLGSNDNVHVDVRVITATNMDLQQAIKEKRFREDLYYRLAVIPIFIPPLHERREDIHPLAMHFARKYGQENNKTIEYIAPDAMDKLIRYPWPGNVRELENTIARAVALCKGKIITADILWPGNHSGSPDAEPVPQADSLRDTLDTHTQSAILKALKIAQGNRSQAARLLGISRASLYNKLKKYQVKEQKFSDRAR